MIKYHINPETGRPNICRADPNNPRSRGCDYAVDGVEPPHYENKKDAQRAYEEKGNKEHGITKTMQKNKKTPSLVLTKATPEEINSKINEKLRDQDFSKKDIINKIANTDKTLFIKDYPTTIFSLSIENKRENGVAFFKDGTKVTLVETDKQSLEEVQRSLSKILQISNRMLFSTERKELIDDLRRNSVLSEKGLELLDHIAKSTSYSEYDEMNFKLIQKQVQLSHSDKINNYPNGTSHRLLNAFSNHDKNMNKTIRRIFKERATEDAENATRNESPEKVLEDFMNNHNQYKKNARKSVLYYDKAFIKALGKIAKDKK